MTDRALPDATGEPYDSDARWGDALIYSGMVKTVPMYEHSGPQCSCPKEPEMIGGHLYIVIDAGCPFHGAKSHHVARMGEGAERRRDTKKHTAHGRKE